MSSRYPKSIDFLKIIRLFAALMPAALLAQTPVSNLQLRLSTELKIAQVECKEFECDEGLRKEFYNSNLSEPVKNRITLIQAYSQAMAANPALRAVRAQFDAVRERLEQSNAQLKPRVSLSANRAYNDVNQSAVLGSAKQSQHASSNVNLLMRLPIYRPILNSGIKISMAQVRDAESQLIAEQQAVAVRVVEAYLQILSFEGKSMLLNRQIKFAQNNIKSAQIRLTAGSGIKTDIDEWRAKADILSAQYLEATQERQSALFLLGNLIKNPVTDVYPLNAAYFDLSEFQVHQTSFWMNKASVQSPELAAMRARVEAASVEIERAKNGYLPTLDGQIQIGKSHGENTTLPSNSVINRQIGIQLDVPLYSGGAIQSVERQAVAEHDRVKALLDSAQQDLYVRIQREWRHITESSARIAALNQAIFSADQLTVSAQRSFAAGLRTELDVANAKEQAHQVRHERFQSQLTLVGARLRLLALVGDLDEMQIANAQTWFDSDMGDLALNNHRAQK